MSFTAPKLFNELSEYLDKEYVFCIASRHVTILDASELPEGLRNEFVKHASSLTDRAKVRVVRMGSLWAIDDGDKQYMIRNEKSALYVYRKRSLTGEVRSETVADTIISHIDGRHKKLGIQTHQNGFDGALVRLFGRLSELIVERLEKVPEKHFLAFLGRAGIDLLPPTPAETDITIDLEVKPGEPIESVLVPEGTQVATQATEAHPEIIFETQGPLSVVANTLTNCIVVDPIRMADRTSLVTDVNARAFRAFEGIEQRKRLFYLAVDKLFDFADDPSRLNATFSFKFDVDASPKESCNLGATAGETGRLEVRYWDGSKWQQIADACVQDNTNGFVRSGSVVIGNPPLFYLDNNVRNGLSRGELSEEVRTQFAKANEALTAEAIVMVRVVGTRHETPEARTDEQDAKEWIIEDVNKTQYRIREQAQLLAVHKLLRMEKCLVGPPEIPDGYLFDIDAEPFDGLDSEQVETELKNALIEAVKSYGIDFNGGSALTLLPGDPQKQVRELKDANGLALIVTHEGDVYRVTFPQEPQIWLELALTDIGEMRSFPAIAVVKAERTVEIDARYAVVDQAFSAVPDNDAFVPLAVTDGFFPLGQRPSQLDAFYVRSDEAFSKVSSDPKARITLELEGMGGVDEDAESDALRAVEVVWEYYGIQGWQPLGTSKRAEYLFDVAPELVDELRTKRLITLRQQINEKLSELGQQSGEDYVPLGQKIQVTTVQDAFLWRIEDRSLSGKNVRAVYTIRRVGESLRVYRPGKVESRALGFEDTSEAFTAVEVDSHTPACVSFEIPHSYSEARFVQTSVNGIVGYWIRARLVNGSYEVPPVIPVPRLFRRTPEPKLPRFFAPQVKSLRIRYEGVKETMSMRGEDFRALSIVDGMLRVHTSALKRNEAFRPFSAKDEHPAMYLGWEKRFPGGRQINLLLDIEEQQSPHAVPLQWEYWSGRGWTHLEAGGEGKNLTQYGPVNFVAPPEFRAAQASPNTAKSDHRLSTEFGRNAYWLRARRSMRIAQHPVGNPSARQVFEDTGNVDASRSAQTRFKVILDASTVKALSGRFIAHYQWQQRALAVQRTTELSGVALLEHTGAQWVATMYASAREARLYIDTQSVTPNNGQTHRFHWRLTKRSAVFPTSNDTTTAKFESVSGQWVVTMDPTATRARIAIEPGAVLANNGAPPCYCVHLQQADDANLKRVVLNSIRLNNAKALNARTFTDMIIGSSDGKRNQRFALSGQPVIHKGVQIAVREPDIPPADELRVLRKELQPLLEEIHEVDPNADALLPAEAGRLPGQGKWVRWHRVDSFCDSKKTSRHFVVDFIVDPNSGDFVVNEICFGDGEFGMIPPAGRNNIKALVFRTQNGAFGRVEADTISVLRNPKNALAKIRSVTNPEPSVRGSNIESVAEVKMRGPQTLKHRQKAVTKGGFEWLAKEFSSEVKRAHVVVGRNPQGIAETGAVTVVIVPEGPAYVADRASEQAIDYRRPMPLPSLVRAVQKHLEDRAVTSLGESTKHIHVIGPEYVCVDVTASIIVKLGSDSDVVCRDVETRLARFLHPLHGGTDGGRSAGWEFGRDIFLSEVLAEIEAVRGVDRCKGVHIDGSIDNLRAFVQNPRSQVLRRIRAAPPGCVVSNYDDRLRMVLADPPVLEVAISQVGLPLFGFKEHDKVALVSVHDLPTIDDLEIVALDRLPSVAVDGSLGITLRATLDWPRGRDLRMRLKASDGLLAQHKKVRMTLDRQWQEQISIGDEQSLLLDSQRNLKVWVQVLKLEDEINIWEEGREEAVATFSVKDVKRSADQIFVPDGHLVYPGTIDVTPVVK